MHPIGVHVGPGLTDDNELDDGGPLARAAEMDADGVQIFLTDPQSYKTPEAAAGRRRRCWQSDVMVVVHAPYMLNVASTNNRIRVPGRKLLAQHAQAAAAVGARGLVVHGGHVLAEDDPAVGVDNWRKTFAYQAKDGGFPLPLFIENTAGGGNAMARDLDAIARLWDAIGEFGAGFVLDTCHAWAAGWDLAHRRRRRPGDHRPDRPGPPQQQPRPARLQPRPARPADRRRDPDRAARRGRPGRRLPGRPGDPRRRRRPRRGDRAPARGAA